MKLFGGEVLILEIIQIWGALALEIIQIWGGGTYTRNNTNWGGAIILENIQ